MLLLRLVTRLVGVLLMLVLALVGLGVAMYCFDGFIRLGSVRPDRLLGLPNGRRHVVRFLDQLAAPGPTAVLALLCGLTAILIGILLLVGSLRSRKERLVILERDADNGTLAARPRALSAMSRVLAERAAGATSVKRPRVKLSRRGTRGRLKLNATRTRTSGRSEVEQAIRDQVKPLSDPFALKPQVRVRVGDSGERVQ